MKLIEDDRSDTLERRVLLQHARQHALGDDLDARCTRDARVKAHAIADGFADAFAQRGGHATRNRARRKPPRLEHHEPLVRRPGLSEQGERHNRALARARAAPAAPRRHAARAPRKVAAARHRSAGRRGGSPDVHALRGTQVQPIRGLHIECSARDAPMANGGVQPQAPLQSALSATECATWRPQTKSILR